MRLIDADKLKEVFKETDVHYGGKIKELIDNAPTVPQVTVFAENASKEEIADFKQELENVLERPQGEWKTPTSIFKGNYFCNNCNGFVIDKSNFCPNCGADMRNNKKETTFDDYLKEQLKDPEFRKEWEKLQDEDIHKGGKEE